MVPTSTEVVPVVPTAGADVVFAGELGKGTASVLEDAALVSGTAGVVPWLFVVLTLVVL